MKVETLNRMISSFVPSIVKVEVLYRENEFGLSETWVRCECGAIVEFCTTYIDPKFSCLILRSVVRELVRFSM